MRELVLTSGLEPDDQGADDARDPALQRGHQEAVAPVPARPEQTVVNDVNDQISANLLLYPRVLMALLTKAAGDGDSKPGCDIMHLLETLSTCPGST